MPVGCLYRTVLSNSSRRLRRAHDCDSRKESTTRMVIARLLTWCSQECANFVRLRELKMVAEATEYMNEFDSINGEDGRQRLTTSNLSRNREGMVVTRINTVLGVVIIIGMGQVHKIIHGFLLALTVGSRAIKLLSAQRSLGIGKIIAKHLLVKGPIRLDELPHLEFPLCLEQL